MSISEGRAMTILRDKSLGQRADDLIVYLEPNYTEGGLYDRIEPLLLFASKVAVYGPIQSEMERQGLSVGRFENWLREGWVNIPIFEDFLDPVSRRSRPWPPLKQMSYLDGRLRAWAGKGVVIVPVEKRKANADLVSDLVHTDPEPLRIMLKNREWLPARFRQTGYDSSLFHEEAEHVLFDFMNDVTAGSAVGPFLPFEAVAAWGNLHAAVALSYPDVIGARIPVIAPRLTESDTLSAFDEIQQIGVFLEWLRTEQVTSIEQFRTHTIAGRTGDAWLRHRILRVLREISKQSRDPTAGNIDSVVSLYDSLKSDYHELLEEANGWTQMLRRSKWPMTLTGSAAGMITGSLISSLLGLMFVPLDAIWGVILKIVTGAVVGKMVTPDLLNAIRLRTTDVWFGNYYAYLSEVTDNK